MVKRLEGNKDIRSRRVTEPARDGQDDKVARIEAEAQRIAVMLGAQDPDPEPLTPGAQAEVDSVNGRPGAIVGPDGKAISLASQIAAKEVAAKETAGARLLALAKERVPENRQTQDTGVEALADIVTNSFNHFKKNGFDDALAVELTKTYAILEFVNVLEKMRAATTTP